MIKYILIGLLVCTQAYSIRCGNRVIMVNDPIYYVTENCNVIGRAINKIYIYKDGITYVIKHHNGQVKAIERIGR